jgi:hypothetical protein
MSQPSGPLDKILKNSRTDDSKHKIPTINQKQSLKSLRSGKHIA